ncbi:hypothetical protein [Phenylobacterium montanum]|uniref:Uncharacterized protein n=1 Tax=Phenylobacterium montanum TaxID=2823693 RepID=A0A975IUB0_9CAUL|nr:hypothetical protein [Caulobacter sp. S6]QUD86056.1 hypothetical protein KCG34_13170 [Caulobacter sp. S6]
MSKPNDITKLQFLGCVDYAQHNFARLKPLLYSETGRRWDGVADRSWFPNEGLVFAVQAELRYSQNGSHWIFRLAPNARGDAIDKDVFSAIQAKPAVELIIGMEPLDIEPLRQLVTETGLSPCPLGKAGAAVPELNDRWVVINELARDDDGRCRPATSVNLKHLKVLIGTPEELCGMATQSGHYVLPPLHPASGESRNWLPPTQFLETLAADLRRWVPHGPQRPKAQAAAQALRELAPQMLGLSALRADDAKVAIARAAYLTEAAETITGAASTILELIGEQEPFKAEIERRRVKINAELEAEALAAVEQKEGAARDRLRAEQASLRAEIDIAAGRLVTLKSEIASLESEAETLRSAKADHVEALDAEVDAVLQRAASEPARLLAEWLGVSGLVVGGVGGGDTEPPITTEPDSLAPVAGSAAPARPVEAGDLGALLFAAGPATNPGQPRLLVLDAALRARELPVLIGPFAREFAEAWLSVVGGATPVTIMTDPTLLSVNDLTPTGQRGEKAPLHDAFVRARSRSEPVVVILDDLDPAAAGFWLPELARCQRNPQRYGFPSNLLFMAVIEADPSQMNLTRLRAGELFPLLFDDCHPTGATPERPAVPFDLAPGLVAEPASSTSWPARLAAFEAALAITFKPDDAKSLADGFSDFLQHCKGTGASPKADGSLAALLAKSANSLRNGTAGEI